MTSSKNKNSLSDLQNSSIDELNDLSNDFDSISVVQNIAISNLVTDKQDRTYLDMEAVEGLAQSILAVDEVLNPLLVQELSKNKFLVVGGHRRLEACKLLVKEGYHKFDHVLCKVKSSHLSMAMLIDNLSKKDLNAIETAFALKRRLDDDSLGFDSQKDLAFAIGRHESFVSRHLKLLELPDEVLEVGQLGLILDPARLVKLSKLIRYVDACEAIKKGAIFKDVILDFANEKRVEPEPVIKLKGDNIVFLCRALEKIEGLGFSFIEDEPVKSLNDFLVHLSKLKD